MTEVRPSIHLASGRPWFFTNPLPEEVHWMDLAAGLAKQSRFCGHTKLAPISIAQHCVLGANLIYKLTGDKDKAAYFLLHDSHEGLGMCDLPSPIKSWLKAMGDLTIYNQLVWKTDQAVHTAAGLKWPCQYQNQIKQTDAEAVATERRDCLADSQEPWRAVMEAPWPDKITPWPWGTAQEKFLAACNKYLPSLRNKDKGTYPVTCTPIKDAV